jgi:hypothetical protein
MRRARDARSGALVMVREATHALRCRDIGDVEYLIVQRDLAGKGKGGARSARSAGSGTYTMNALTDAEMIPAFGALNADRKELIFTCMQLLLEEQHEDERAGNVVALRSAPAPD